MIDTNISDKQIIQNLIAKLHDAVDHMTDEQAKALLDTGTIQVVERIVAAIRIGQRAGGITVNDVLGAIRRGIATGKEVAR